MSERSALHAEPSRPQFSHRGVASARAVLINKVTVVNINTNNININTNNNQPSLERSQSSTLPARSTKNVSFFILFFLEKGFDI